MKQVKLKSNLTLMLVLALLGSMVLPVYAAVSADSTDETVIMPIAENQECSTYQNVKVQGTLRATDPDGGVLTYEIVEMPKKGTVVLDEKDSAAFVYTPNQGKSGKDAFSFCVKDEKGNISAPATVKVEILKDKKNVRYGDMENNAAHAASIRLAEEGVFTGRQVGTEFFFEPDAAVSRSEFLTMAMTAAGVDTLETVNVTGFSDDASIPTWAKAYASEALNTGIISGKMENDRVVFSADAPITYNEAAAILNRLMAVTDADTATFAGNNVPAWAAQSVTNLASVDVMGQVADCGAALTRADAAELLCSAMDLMQEKNDSPFAWLR